MSVFEDKYYVFLISSGRTGTRFFGDILHKTIFEGYSVHEPDVLTPRRDYQIVDKFKTFGFYHLVLGKLIGQTGIRNLSQNHQAGKISLSELKKAIIRHRKKYYEKIPQELIIESYSGWYGCIAAIRELYRNYKIVIVTRDPRDWVTSNMNWGTLFGKKDWVNKMGLGRLDPAMIHDEEYTEKWKSFSRFEKICWTFKAQYDIMLKEASFDSNVKIVKFEDIFQNEKGHEYLDELLKFITEFKRKRFDYDLSREILKKKVHSNDSFGFPPYEKWESHLKKQFDDICKECMISLNY